MFHKDHRIFKHILSDYQTGLAWEWNEEIPTLRTLLINITVTLTNNYSARSEHLPLRARDAPHLHHQLDGDEMRKELINWLIFYLFYFNNSHRPSSDLPDDMYLG